MFNIMRRYESFYRRGSAMPVAAIGGGMAIPMEVNRAEGRRDGARHGRDRRDTKCYACGKMGHIARECKSAAISPGKQYHGRGRRHQVRGVDEDNEGDDVGYDSGITQYKGPVKHVDYQAKPMVHDAGVVILERPRGASTRHLRWSGSVVTSKGTQRAAKILIDSGATGNMVSRQFASGLLRKATGHQKTVFRFANGTYYESDQFCPNVQLQIQEYRTKVDLLICELNDGIDVILGMAWLNKENPDINWSTGTVTLPDAERATTVAPTATTARMRNQENAAMDEGDTPVGGNETKGNREDGVAGSRIEMLSGSRMRRLLRKQDVMSVVLFASQAEEGVYLVNDGTPSAVEQGAPGLNDGTPQVVREVVLQFTDLFRKPMSLPPSGA